MIRLHTIVFVLVLLWCLPMCVHAQVADTLKEVHIKGRRKQVLANDERVNSFSPGQKIKNIDSFTLQQYQFQNMANLLAQQTPVFIKSYGVNGLATLNFRGASAAQSQVYWNGIPIQNAALGISDVSLLPVSLMNKVNIVYGSSSALWGSGNVGGALLVENNIPVFDGNGKSECSVAAAAGSYGQFQGGAKGALSAARWYLEANAFAQAAKNDFTYTDNGAEKTLDNAALHSGAAMLNAGYKLDSKNTFTLTGWYQQYSREIPAALFESSSVKDQRDESLRLLAGWNRQGIKANIYAKAAYLRDYVQYSDTTVKLLSNNTASQVYSEAGVKYNFSNSHKLLVFLPVSISWIDSQNYGNLKTQNRIALAAAYAFTHFDERLNISASARGEAINDKQIFLPGVNASFAFTDWLTIRANTQRTYRAPTLNELYYYPGGNDKLKPERGWGMDAGYNLKTSIGHRLTFTHDLSVFDRNVHDWIIWFGGAIWTPHNIATVHSRGVETENTLQYRIGKWKLHAGVNTSYVLATTIQSYLPGDSSIGKQIPYTPRYNGQVNMGFTFKGFYFNYNHTYTGYRFYTTDESRYLEPYNTGNIQLFYTAYVHTLPVQFTAQLNNTWNTRYEVVNARPAPGTNFLLGIRATLLQ